MAERTASYLIGRADRIVRAQLDAALEGTGLSLPEFTALSVLSVRPGLSNAQLARRSLVTPQAVHKVIRSLEDAGLVTRRTPPQGGRSLAATITDAGADLVADVMPRIADAEDRALASLEPDDRRELVRLLSLVTARWIS